MSIQVPDVAQLRRDIKNAFSGSLEAGKEGLSSPEIIENLSSAIADAVHAHIQDIVVTINRGISVEIITPTKLSGVITGTSTDTSLANQKVSIDIVSPMRLKGVTTGVGTSETLDTV
jgi:hypothetical protein